MLRPVALMSTLALLLAPLGAEAGRFGKRSEEKSEEHEASAHGEERRDGERREEGRRRYHHGHHGAGLFFDVLFTLLTPRHTTVVVEAPPPAAVVAEPPPPPPAPAPEPAGEPEGRGMLQLAVEGQGFRQGGGAGLLGLTLEGERWGLDGRAQAMLLPAVDGSADTDALAFTHAHLTYALVAADRVRWRLGAGVDTAHAPDVDMLGLGLSSSFEACVVGPFDLEARAQLTPFPFGRVEGQVGAALHLGALVLRAGVRHQRIDDHGVVDGVRNVERLTGPYLGVALRFQ